MKDSDLNWREQKQRDSEDPRLMVEEKKQVVAQVFVEEKVMRVYANINFCT
jgi:hypothetical protein